MVVKYMVPGVRLSWVAFQFLHLLAPWPWGSYLSSLSLTFPNAKMGIVVMSKRQNHDKSIAQCPACRKYSVVFINIIFFFKPSLFFWCQLWPRLNSKEALLFGFSFEGSALLFPHIDPSIVPQICYISFAHSSVSLLMLTPFHVLPSSSCQFGKLSLTL